MIVSQPTSLMEPPTTNKSELPPPVLPKRPSQGSQHGMCLPLLSSDQGNNAFTAESSLSSSKTLLLYDRGETSPDSMRSLSSLSSARTDSPLDVDMPDAEMGKITANSDDSGIQSPDCRPDYTEDNDNSVSVYLDANEYCWSDNDNHNITLVVAQNVDQNDADDTSLCSTENGGGDDEDDTKEEEEEEEDSFLSLASVELILKNEVVVSALEVTTNPEVVIPDISQGQPAEVPNMAKVNKPQREVVHENGEVSVELSSAIQKTDIMNETVESLENKVSTPLTSTRNITSSHSSISKEDTKPKSTAKKTSDRAGHVFAKPHTRAAMTKATKLEVKRFPRPDLRNVKAKIISRASSVPRSDNPAKTNMNVKQSASGSVKVPARKVEDNAVGKRSRSSSTHTRGKETKTCQSAEVAFNGGPEKDVNTLSLPTQGEETAMKSECLPPSIDFKVEGEPQLDKEAGEETSKSNSKVSDNLIHLDLIY